MKKYRKVKKYNTPLDLQLFAGEDGADGGEPGEGDDQDGEENPDKDGEEDQEEKRFSQKDIDEAIKKRIAREKRKWQREQQPSTQKSKEDKPEGQEEDKEKTELREKAQKAEDLELKWTCLEHEVDKSCVDDVLALTKVIASKDGIDIEDAIDKVLKKYPHFKASYKEDDEETKGKSWGERQNSRKNKTSGVEDAFLKKNPGLKI